MRMSFDDRNNEIDRVRIPSFIGPLTKIFFTVCSQIPLNSTMKKLAVRRDTYVYVYATFYVQTQCSFFDTLLDLKYISFLINNQAFVGVIEYTYALCKNIGLYECMRIFIGELEQSFFAHRIRLPLCSHRLQNDYLNKDGRHD